MIEGEEKGLRYIEDSISVGTVETLLWGNYGREPRRKQKRHQTNEYVCVVQNLQMILED